MQDGPLSLWRLASDLSVENAATLIAGGDPDSGIRPDGFNAVFSALKAAIWKKQLAADMAYTAYSNAPFRGSQATGGLRESPELWIISAHKLQEVLSGGEESLPHPRGELWIQREPNWSKTMVDTERLKEWLRSRGFTTGFFFPPEVTSPDDFLDNTHDHFAPELALALTIWRELANERKFPGGVKKRIEAWIRAHPEAWQGEDQLTDRAKNRISTLMNWNPSGGAPKTGG